MWRGTAVRPRRALRWAGSTLVELNERVARRITVEHADGMVIEGAPFAFEGGLGLCIVGGLPADADLAWTVTEGTEPRIQEVNTVLLGSAHWRNLTWDATLGPGAAPLSMRLALGYSPTTSALDGVPIFLGAGSGLSISKLIPLADHWSVDALVGVPMPLMVEHPVFLPAVQVRGEL